MNNILFSLFTFFLTISFLVFIHEYGHFWVARRFGVRIEKFSIGFGKPILKWYGKRDNTEYSLSWIPLGGYVKMYGENSESREDTATPNADNVMIDDLSGNSCNIDNTGSFSALPPFKRLLIAFAGPAVNLIFAILALWVLFIIGVPAIKPTIGTVQEQSVLHKAHISRGDNIVEINGYSVSTMSDAAVAFIDALGGKSVALKAVDENGQGKTAYLDLSSYQAGSEKAVEKLAGFDWAIAEIVTHLPAIIDNVGKDTPAQRAGLLAGDKIQSVDGKNITYWKDVVSIVRDNPNRSINMIVDRAGVTQSLVMLVGTHPKSAKVGYAGVSPRFDEKEFEKLRTVKRYGWLEALPKSISSNYLQGEIMLKTLWRLVWGKASVDNLGGPLSIADYSSKTFSAGYVSYFYFLASISLVLAVMNLLPIPVLDGGLIALCAIEMLRGKPLSDKVVEVLFRLGGSILATFMILVIGLDIWRYLFA